MPRSVVIAIAVATTLGVILVTSIPNIPWLNAIVISIVGGIVTGLIARHVVKERNNERETTLNYNPEGEFFVKVLGNGDFQAWAEQVFQEEGNLNKMTIGSRDAVCAVAAGIVFLKCWGTWYGNFLCWASLGTGVACLIGIVGRWIHGWD